MALTIGGLLGEARAILNDVTPTVGGATRYSDSDLVNAFNEAMLLARIKRPDLFLGIGLRNAIPQFAMPNDATTSFPLDQMYYSPFIWFVVGRSESREDTFTDDARAMQAMQRFTAELMGVNA